MRKIIIPVFHAYRGKNSDNTPRLIYHIRSSLSTKRRSIRPGIPRFSASVRAASIRAKKYSDPV
jgi:hypothetical protein